ncbi:MAG: NAD(P)/FAD-dependent oxidoreductase [Oscillospiraceae bacterium]
MARIEHLQSEIDKGLYGTLAGHPALPAGEYQLSLRENGRAVYTFCMCPGGFVVPSSSEENTVVTNGMSEYLRNQPNANAALVVSVGPEDFGNGPLDGMVFQRRLERAAFTAGGGDYRAPAQTVGHFLQGKPGLQLGQVCPSYACGVTPGDLDSLLPAFVTNMMRRGLSAFGRKLPGYDSADAVLTGLETRTSSPVRIVRGI